MLNAGGGACGHQEVRTTKTSFEQCRFFARAERNEHPRSQLGHLRGKAVAQAFDGACKTEHLNSECCLLTG